MMWSAEKWGRKAWARDEHDPDPDEGLPPLAEGWSWELKPDGFGGCAVEKFPGGGTCQHYFATTGALQAGRHLLARYDRSKGRYLPDLMRALAGELLTSAERADRLSRDTSIYTDQGRAVSYGQRVGYEDAAQRLLALLDEVGL